MQGHELGFGCVDRLTRYSSLVSIKLQGARIRRSTFSFLFSHGNYELTPVIQSNRAGEGLYHTAPIYWCQLEDMQDEEKISVSGRKSG